MPDSYDDAGDRRVDFYVEDDAEESIVGEENAIPLGVGDCICVGIREGDQLLEDLDDEIVIHADEDCPPEIPPEEPPNETIDRPRSIGFWSNWSGDCTPGGQDNVLGETLDAASGIDLGDLTVTRGDHAESPNCGAVNLLLKRDLGGTVRANDGAYNLASQLLAAKLNEAAGASVPGDGTGEPGEDCDDVRAQIDAGQALLDDLDFDGTGSYLPPGTDDRQEALDIAECLDRYNNGEFT